MLCKNQFRVKDEVYGRKKADFLKYRNLCHRKCLEKAAANELITTNQFLEFVEKKYLERIEGQPKTIQAVLPLEIITELSDTNKSWMGK